MSLRTPSVFTATTESEATDEKIQLGLEPRLGDEGLQNDLSAQNTVSRSGQRARTVVCNEDGRANPRNRRLRVASVFECPNNDNLCQRTLFLNNGFILAENDPSSSIIDSVVGQ